MDNVQRMVAPINIPKTFLAGLTATGVMSIFMIAAPLIGMPHVKIGVFLGAIAGGIKAVGWIIHFLIGIGFAFLYARFVNNSLPVENNIARGVIYGIGVFLFAQMVLFTFAFLNWLSVDLMQDMALSVFVNFLGHLIYGAVLGTFYPKKRKGDIMQPVPDHR